MLAELIRQRRSSREEEEEEAETMFPGMFMRKPNKAASLKQLKAHVGMFGAWVVVIRVAPYILHYFSDQKEELKLEL